MNAEHPITTDIPMTFALREGRVVHVDEVPNGLACGCVCAACLEPLIARHGQIREHGFAHASGAQCAGGAETALHRAAKQLIMEEKALMLPGVALQGEAWDSAGQLYLADGALPTQRVRFTEIQLETAVGEFVPDLIGTLGARRLLIEIAVTHAVDDAKRSKVRAAGLAMVEISLSPAVALWGWETLRTALLDDGRHARWIYNPKIDALQASLNQQAFDLAQQASLADEDMLEDLNAVHAQRRRVIPGFLQDLARLEEMCKPDRRHLRRSRRELEGRHHPQWQAAARALGIDWYTQTPFLDVDTPGDDALPVAPRVWQAALYVHLQHSHPSSTFGAWQALRWVASTFAPLKEFPILRRHLQLLTEEQRAALPWAAKAVLTYLQALAQRGVLQQRGVSFRVNS